jgi:hypothetical protein
LGAGGRSRARQGSGVPARVSLRFWAGHWGTSAAGLPCSLTRKKKEDGTERFRTNTENHPELPKNGLPGPSQCRSSGMEGAFTPPPFESFLLFLSYSRTLPLPSVIGLPGNPLLSSSLIFSPLVCLPPLPAPLHSPRHHPSLAVHPCVVEKNRPWSSNGRPKVISTK